MATATTSGDRVQVLAFSPDGAMLASGAAFNDPVIRLWDVATGREIGRLEGHRNWISSLVFWPDGKTLASGSADRTIRLWDVPGRRTTRILRGHKNQLRQLALLSDAGTLASGDKDGDVYLWDVTSSPGTKPVAALLQPVENWRFDDDSRSVITVDFDGEIVRWGGTGFKDKQPLLNIGVVARVNRHFALIHVSDRWPLVAVGSRRGRIRVADWKRRAIVREIQISDGPVLPLSFTKGGQRLTVLNRPIMALQEFDLETGLEISRWGSPDTKSYGLLSAECVVSPAENERLTPGFNGQAVFRNMITGTETEMDIRMREAEDPKYSPDGRFVAVAGPVTGTKLWATATREEIAVYPEILKSPHAVAFSPDSSRLVTANGGAEAIILWDIESHEPLLTLAGEGPTFRRAAFSPDGNVLGARSEARLLHLWRAPSWAEIEQAEKGHAAPAKRP